MSEKRGEPGGEVFHTKFAIGQTIFYARVDRVMEERACSVCGGEGKIETVARDGSVHRVECPAARYQARARELAREEGRCWHGRVSLGVRHAADKLRPMTVGRVNVEYGGLSGFTNMGGPKDQNYKLEESVMCYETGIGSGSVYRTEPYFPDRWGTVCSWGIFAHPEEAEEWAAKTVAILDGMLATELAYEEALAENEVRSEAMLTEVP